MTKRIRVLMSAGIVFFLLLTVGMVAVGLALNKDTEYREPERSVPVKGDTAPVSYPYSQLNNREKALYDALYEGILAHKEEIRLPDTYRRYEYEKVYLMVSMQEPELFGLDKVYETTDMMQEAKIHYAVKKENEAQMRAEMERKADEIIGKFSPIQSDGQKMLVIHDEIAAGCRYAEPLGLPDSAYTALVLGEARCEGYAKAFAYVCRRAGLDAMLVTGKSQRGENHVWNKANFDGVYYNVDVTWDDDNSYLGNVVHTCFGMADSVFGDHLPDYQGFVPPASGMGTDQTYYYQRNLRVRDMPSLGEQLRDWMRQTGGRTVEFQCADTLSFDAVCHTLKTDPTLCTLENCGMTLQGRHLTTDKNRQVIVIMP